MAKSLTHVEGDSDDVEGHGGVCDAAEWWRLEARIIKSQSQRITKKYEAMKNV